VGEDGVALLGQAQRPGPHGQRQPAVPGSGVVDCPDGQPMARSAGLSWQVDTVFKRYSDWVKADVFRRIFDAVSDDPDMEYAMVDATIVKVHRHGHGAKGGLKNRRSASPRVAGRRKSSR